MLASPGGEGDTLATESRIRSTGGHGRHHRFRRVDGATSDSRASMRVTTADSTTSMPTASLALGGNQGDLKPAWCLLAAPVAIGLALAGIVVSLDADGPTATQIVGVILVALVGGGGRGAWGSTPTGSARPDRARRSDRRRGDLSGRGPRGERTGGRLHGRSRLDRSPARPHAAPGIRLAHVRGAARRAPHQPGASTKRRGRIRRRSRRRWRAVRRPRRHRDVADRRPVDRGAGSRHLRRLAAVPRRRCGRTPPHAVDRLGDSPSRPKACSS